VPKRERWQIVAGFALLGLAVAGAWYAYWAFYDYSKPENSLRFVLMIASEILCPPQLLFLICIDCEVIGWNGLFVYSIIGVLNAILYAIVGFVFVQRQNASK